MPTALQEDGGGGGEEEEGQSGESSSPHPHAAQILDIVLEHVLHFLPSARDRAACSLVSRSWHRADSLTRAHVSVGNCYAVSPARVAQRFPRARSLLLKGRPRFADFGLMPPGWGAHLRPWLHAPFPLLRRLHLKRLSLSDHHLALLPAALPALCDLHLLCCEGFGTSGLAAFAVACAALRELDLVDTDVEDDEVDWIAAFSSASIESLVFDCVVADLNFDALEALVGRCRGLRRLRVGHQVDAAQLCRLLARAPPGLTDLGTGSFHSPDGADRSAQLASCFAALRSLRCLSGFRNAAPELLPSVYSACHRLTFLNLSYAAVDSAQFRPIISQCHRLQCLWVLDSIGDEGLLAVADTCKDLEELRVFPTEAQEDTESLVSDVGLVAISSGCRSLRSILYFCQCMTNKAVVTMSENCRALRVFRLCIMGRHRPDHRTGEPMDEGFGAIVRNCHGLTRLAVSGLLTDRAFAYIGKYGKILRTLSVAFAGDGDQGLKYVLEGCPKLQKLEIRDSPFGDLGLLSGIHHYYNMRFLWMSACKLTFRGCSEVARRLPNLVVEVIRDPESGYAKNAEDEDEESHRHVETLYMYRSLAGPRTDVPQFVKIL